MASKQVTVAVIGAGGFGGRMLAALRELPGVQVVGLSDRKADLAEQIGKQTGIPAFNDNRALLAQSRPQAVFLAVPPATAPELVNACADRGIHVWKEMPLARTLAEGVAMVRRLEAGGLKLAVGTQRRFALSYRRAHELSPQLGRIFLCRAHYLFNWGAHLGWRGDMASAGGGALMELAYHPIDLLVWMLGLPEEVYGLSARSAARDVEAPNAMAVPVYDTDDTAAAIMRYGKECMATVVTTRSSGPVSEELSLHGQGGSLVANGETCLFRDRDGNVLDRVVDDITPLTVFKRQAQAFLDAVASDSPTYGCSARENLLTLATIEAIYLSDKTSTPEAPLRLLHTHGLTVEDCLRLRPAPPAPTQPASHTRPQ